MNSEFRILNIELRSVLVFSLMIMITCVSYSQEIPTLKFQKDSVLIGELTPVKFTYKHDSSEEVLFVDSLYDFSPFEFEKKEVYPTKTVDSLSIDSVVYWLTTFELDKIQTLRIPVFIFTKGDSIPFYSNVDSIRLTEVITVISDTLKLKENTDLQEVKSEFNYPIFSIVGGVILVISLFLSIVFWKKIILFFKLKKMKKRHSIFLNSIDFALQKFSKEESNNNLESLIVIWKLYLEKLIKKPITKLSTKELESLIENKEVIESLKKTDGMLFGNVKFENALVQIEGLKNYAELAYVDKVDLLKNEGRN